MKLDFIENIEIFDSITPLNNYHSIPQLKTGIIMVYNNMINIQTNYWELQYPDSTPEQIENYKKTKLSINGEFNQIDAQAINLYHWYSINLINYAKCCGLIRFLNKKKILPEYLAQDENLIAELNKEQNEYIKGIPELDPVVHFRNKAGAHLAYTYPAKYDNSATLIESMSIIPAYINGKITIGALKRMRGESVSSFSKYQWNLTDNFESLIPRFFKDNCG